MAVKRRQRENYRCAQFHTRRACACWVNRHLNFIKSTLLRQSLQLHFTLKKLNLKQAT